MIASLIIPIRNEKKFIIKCINTLLENDFPKSKYEIIIVDGMSNDGTLEILKNADWKNVSHQILKNIKMVVPPALNLGIKAAKGKYIIRIDAHTEYDKSYITNCIELLKKNKADNVGGPMRVKSKNTTQRAIGLATSSIFGVGNSSFHFENHSGFVESVYLGAFPRETFKKFGLFDEELTRNQDDEFNYRIINQGGKIYQSPKIKSYYYPRSSFKNLFSQYFQYGYWKVRVIQKLNKIISLRHVSPSIFVLSLVLFGILGLIFPIFSNVLFIFLILYIAANLIFTFKISLNETLPVKLKLPITFLCLHFGYGLGFLFGLFKFYCRIARSP